MTYLGLALMILKFIKLEKRMSLNYKKNNIRLKLIAAYASLPKLPKKIL
jgi:hypothetical protein